MKFVGLKNYQKLFSDKQIWQSTINTLYYMLLTVPVGVFLALILAVLLNTRIRGRDVYRAIYFLPMVAAPAAVAMVWKWIFNAEAGILNQFLGLFGIGRINWLSDPNTALLSCAIIGIWSAVGYDLVLILAHDLKTPLTSIVAYLSMLDGYPKMPEEERKKYIHIALEKSNRLGELINEFFDITRYNLQNIELESVKINLTMMLEQIADELYGVLQEKKLTCDVDVEENLEVYGDPDKLARVFDNILRNAIAYCYENTKIEIQARMKNNKIEITFTNSGDRIPGDMLQTIFEKFYRVDNSRSTGTGGAGLGLAIAKEIVELHDGQIMAKSDDLHTQFIVTLPSENELEENEEGSKNEIHTHRRHTFGGSPVQWKLPKGKAGKGDMDQS